MQQFFIIVIQNGNWVYVYLMFLDGRDHPVIP